MWKNPSLSFRPQPPPLPHSRRRLRSTHSKPLGHLILVDLKPQHPSPLSIHPFPLARPHCQQLCSHPHPHSHPHRWLQAVTLMLALARFPHPHPFRLFRTRPHSNQQQVRTLETLVTLVTFQLPQDSPRVTRLCHPISISKQQSNPLPSLMTGSFSSLNIHHFHGDQ